MITFICGRRYIVLIIWHYGRLDLHLSKFQAMQYRYESTAIAQREFIWSQ